MPPPNHQHPRRKCVIHINLTHYLPLPDVYQIVGHSQQLGSDPIITPHYACLYCRSAFTLDAQGIREVT